MNAHDKAEALRLLSELNESVGKYAAAIRNDKRNGMTMATAAEVDKHVDAIRSLLSAQGCGCGLATCVEPWEPGCGLGTSKEHAVRVDAASSGCDAAHCGDCGATDGEECGACPPAQAVSVPDGFVLVPKVPTPEMMADGRTALRAGEMHINDAVHSVYKAMLSAATAAATREGKE